MLTYGAFALGAACMLLGFYSVVRGIGAGDSGTDVKMFGIEISASKLGPGLVFSFLGLILVLVAVFVQPKLEGGRAEMTAGGAPVAAPAAGPGVTPVTAETPAAPAPAPRAAEPVYAPAAAQPAAMSRDQVADLVQDTLTKIASGYCPQANLEPLPLAQCNQALPVLQQTLLLAGPIRGVSYYGEITTPAGHADQYLVAFQNVSAIWKTQPTDNRKLASLWTGPPP